MNTGEKFLFVILILFINSKLLLSQNIQILDVDNSNYPHIGITFNLDTDSCLNFDYFSIIENKAKCRYTIDQCLDNQQKKLVCFILEEELFDDKEAREIIGDLLKYSIKNVCGNEILNTVIVSTNNETRLELKPISIEFTDDFNSLRERYGNISLSNIKYTYSLGDFFYYVKKYHSLDNNIVFISKEDTLKTKYKLIKEYVDSAKFNFSELHFPKSYKNTNEVLKSLEKQYSSSNTINSFIDAEQSTKHYKVYYKTSQNNKINFFEIHYNDRVLKYFFRNENDLVKLSDAVTYKYISLFLFLVIIVLLFFIIKNKKKKPDINVAKDEQQNIDTNINKEVVAGRSIQPFVVIEINDKTEKYELNKLRTNIGRASGNDILIAHLTISNHHATITNEGGVFFIEDNDSTNGVKVNDVKVSKQAVNPKDIIRLGQAILHFNY